MANQLAMDKALAIKSLAAAGYSGRRIARTLGISRKAVRRHLAGNCSKVAEAPTGKAPTGSPEPVAPKVAKAPTGSESSETGSKTSTETAAAPGSRSLCAGYQQEIIEKLEQGLTAQRIYQDLCEEHGFSGRYSSVRRYVQRLGAQRELPFRRIEVEPGHELQVD